MIVTTVPTTAPTARLPSLTLSNVPTVLPSSDPTLHSISSLPSFVSTYNPLITTSQSLDRSAGSTSLQTDYDRVTATYRTRNNVSILPTATLSIVTTIASVSTDDLVLDEINTTTENMFYENSNAGLYAVFGALGAVMCGAILCVCIIYKKRKQKDEFERSHNAMVKQASVEEQRVQRLSEIEYDLDNRKSVEMMRTVEGIPDDVNGNGNAHVHTPTKHTRIQLVTVTGAEELKATERVLEREEYKKAMVKYWLTTVVELPFYYNAFIENGYETLEIMREITNNSELVEIGITNTNHQTRIMAEVLVLRNSGVRNIY